MNNEKSFLKWAEEDIAGINLIWFIFQMAILGHILVIIIHSILSFFNGRPEGVVLGKSLKNAVDLGNIFFYFSISAFLEEIIFRLLPLIIPILIFGTSRVVIGVAVVVSILFGYLHGNIYNIAIQGVCGIIYSIVFLKCGGFKRRFIKATLSSSGAHLIYNYMIALSIFIHGGRSI